MGGYRGKASISNYVNLGYYKIIISILAIIAIAKQEYLPLLKLDNQNIKTKKNIIINKSKRGSKPTSCNNENLCIIVIDKLGSQSKSEKIPIGLNTDITKILNQITNKTIKSLRRTIIIPKGSYFITHWDISMNNLHILGSGKSETVLKVSNGVTNRFRQSDGTITIHKGDEGSTDSRANYNNIKINNLCIIGTNTTRNKFNQNLHLIHAHSVTNLTIQKCKFYYPCGDAISISRTGQGSFIRHNYKVLITNNEIKAKNNNRNAISIYDCTECTIRSNKIENSSRSDMPGAIDIEPDLSGLNIKDIKIINNKIINSNGRYGGICIYLNSVDSLNIDIERNGKFKNIFLISNEITNDTLFNLENHNKTPGFFLAQKGNLNSINEINVLIENNKIVSMNSPFQIWGGKKITLNKNIYMNCIESANIGLISSNVNDKVENISINDLFDNCGNTSGSCLYVKNLKGGTIKGEFINCGGQGGAIQFYPYGKSQNILIQSILRNPSKQNTLGIYVYKTHQITNYSFKGKLYDNLINRD